MRRILLLVVVMLISTGCSPDALLPADQPLTAESPNRESTLPFIDIEEPTSLPNGANIPPAEGSPLVLGSPFYIGRGSIVGAEILVGAQQAAVAQGGGISLVRVADASEIWWHPSELPIISLAAHPAGHAVAALLRDGSVLIVDTATGRALHRYATVEHQEVFWGSVAWSPNGTQIAFQPLGPKRHPIYLLDPETGEFEAIPKTKPPNTFSPILMWSPDSRLISARADGACLGFVDVQTGDFVIPPKIIPGATPEQGPQGCYDPIAWTPNSRYLLSNTPEGPGFVDPASGAVVRTFLEASFPISLDHGPLAAFSEDGTLLAGGGVIDDYWGTKTALRIWNPKDNVLITSLGWEDAPDSLEARARTRIAMRFDGESLISVHQNGEIRRWDFRLGGKDQLLGRMRLLVPSPPLVWSDDNNTVATTYQWYKGVAVWSLGSAEPLALYEAPYTSPALSPDGQRIAMIDPVAQSLYITEIGSAAGIQLPDATGIRALYPDGEGDWGGAAFSPDGHWLAYRSYNRVIIVDASHPSERVVVLEGHAPEEDVRAILWSPRSDALITVAGPSDAQTVGDIILWHVDGQSFTELYRATSVHYYYSAYAFTLAQFNASGSLVAIQVSQSHTAGDFDVQVVDTQTGNLIRTLDEHMGIESWLSEDGLITLRNDAGWMTRYITNVWTGEEDTLVPVLVGDEISWGQYYAHASAGAENYIVVSDWRTGRQVYKGNYPGMNTGPQYWSSDGRWLVTGLGDEGMLVVWPVILTK